MKKNYLSNYQAGLYFKRWNYPTLLILFVFLHLFPFSFAIAQETVFWRSEASNANWANTDVNNWWRQGDGWDVRRPDLAFNQWMADGTKSYNIIIFNNAVQLTTNVNGNIGGEKYHVHRLEFRNSSNRVFNASSSGYFALGGGSQNAKIEAVIGEGTGNYTINVPITYEKDTEINPVGGSITIGANITNGGFNTYVWGSSDKNFTFTGELSGEGGLQIKSNTTVIFTGNSSYTGGTIVEAGTLEIQGNIASSAVTVKSGATLIINGNNVTVASLSVESGAFVQVEVNKALTVTGNLSNSGSLTIKSNASGTGSLIVNGTFTGIATVERYLSKYDAQGDNKYHFISSPVAAQNIQPEFVSDPPSPSVDFYKFSETNYEWVNSKLLSGDWNPAFESQFEVGQGYMVAYSVNLTKNFNGALNNNASYVLNCTHTADKGNGWNLLGNPFQAAIDWDAVTLGDGMDNALYYYDSQNEKYNYYIAFAGINNTQYLGTGSRYIPSMQGFMVHAKSTGTKTVTIEKADLAHQAQTTFYKSGYNLVPGSMALTLISGERRDEAFVHFTSGATEAFDGQYDAYKLLSGNAAIPEIYTTNNGNVKFAINGLPELGEQTEVPVSIKANQPGVYTISADLSNLPATAYLNDLKTGTVHNLSQNPAYTFTAAEGDAPNRFKLTFGSVGIEQPVAQSIRVYTSENMLYLLTGGNAARVEVFSLTGQKLMDVETRSNTLPLNLTSGIYLVKVTTSGHTHVQKIIVK
jgi:autotransporter-associated beta strand protein